MAKRTNQPLIKWLPEYAVGVAAIDFEHRDLIELINALYEQHCTSANADTTAGFLGEVYAKISAHFALEEKVMRDRDYDEYEDHKAEHERLLDEIAEIIDDFDAGGNFSPDTLASALSDWFSEHFRTKDARLHGRLV